MAKKEETAEEEVEDEKDDGQDAGDSGGGAADDDGLIESIRRVVSEMLGSSDKGKRHTIADDENRMEQLVREATAKLKKEDERDSKLKRVDELDETLKKLTEQAPVSNTLGGKFKRFMWGE